MTGQVPASKLSLKMAHVHNIIVLEEEVFVGSLV